MPIAVVLVPPRRLRPPAKGGKFPRCRPSHTNLLTDPNSNDGCPFPPALLARFPAESSARSSGTARIKRALSFGNKKKKRPPLADDPPTNHERDPETPKPDSNRSHSSGAATPPAAEPRSRPSQPKPPHTAPAKRTVRRTLSWTKRASKHIEASAKSNVDCMI